MRFRVTIFDDVFAKTMRGEDMTLEELGELIRDTSASAKANLPLLKLGRFGSARTAAPAGCLRHDGNVLAISGLEADYDGGEMPFQEAVDRVEAAGVAFIAYTSPSHAPNRPKWRVFCPFAQEVLPAERERLMNQLNGVLGGTLARESWGISQSFYFGCIVGAPFEMHIGDAEQCFDEGDFAATAQPYRPPPGAAGGKTAAPDFDDMDENELLDVIQSGAHYWGPAKRLLTMWARQGVSQADAESNLDAAFDAVPQAARGKKWGKNRKSIPRWVKDVYARAQKKKGSAIFTQLLAYLEDEPHWHGAVRLNNFTETIEVCTPFPPQPGQRPGSPRAMRDEDLLEVLANVQANGFPLAKKGTVWDVVTLVAARNGYHPVRDWLDGLAWDGQERINRLFIDYFPGELPDPATPNAPTEDELRARDNTVVYYEKVAECFMIGAVARIRQPGCKLDTLPVAVSPQGFDKSQGVQALVPDPAWFSDDLATAVADRDAKESLTGKWIVELAEFPHIRKEVDRVKAFFSRQNDRYRRAYGRLNTDHPRQCVFIATANELEFLDVTGNRRTWPIPLAGRVKVAEIERDREQLWAEAVHWYREGYKWWLSPSLEVIAGELQDAFVEADEWDEPILEWIEKKFPPPPAGEEDKRDIRFTVREILEHALGYGLTPKDVLRPVVATKADEMRVARRLRRLGYRRDPHRGRRNGRAPMWMPVKKLTL